MLDDLGVSDFTQMGKAFLDLRLIEIHIEFVFLKELLTDHTITESREQVEESEGIVADGDQGIKLEEVVDQELRDVLDVHGRELLDDDEELNRELLTLAHLQCIPRFVNYFEEIKGALGHQFPILIFLWRPFLLLIRSILVKNSRAYSLDDLQDDL